MDGPSLWTGSTGVRPVHDLIHAPTIRKTLPVKPVDLRLSLRSD
jgi:hypothetical protein